MTTKLCRDCRWCSPGVSRWLRRKTYHDARCTHPQVSRIARVAPGQMVRADRLRLCLDERDEHPQVAACGQNARLWEDGLHDLPPEVRPGVRAVKEAYATADRSNYEFWRKLLYSEAGAIELLGHDLYRQLQGAARDKGVFFRCHVLKGDCVECVVVHYGEPEQDREAPDV